jgi:hypothetical protein
MTLPPSFAKVSGLAATLPASTESKQANGKKTKEEAKMEKDGRKGKVRTEMETLSSTLRSLLSSNLPPGNHGKTTLQ